MVISFGSALKLVGVIIVCFCATLVCTAFLNFYLDILPLRDGIVSSMLQLYDAQAATAKICCAITGGVLTPTAAIMVAFYVKLYVSEHSKELGTLKALGYSANRLALSFTVFAGAAFIGCALGYGSGHAMLPSVYKSLTIDGLTVEINYHPSLLFALVFAPTISLGIIAYVCAYARLKNPALSILKDLRKEHNVKKSTQRIGTRGFLKEMSVKTISSNKLLTFFVAFSCFCFSATIQMSAAMKSLADDTMGFMMLILGLALAAASAFLALTTLVKNVAKSIAMMKAFGYSLCKCALSIFAAFIPVSLLSFALGTAYQYGLLSLMVNLIFKDVYKVHDYAFDVGMMLVTLAAFILTYTAITAFYVAKINKISVKEIMSEN